MNLIIFEQKDFIDGHIIRLKDRRLEHINLIHKAKKGNQEYKEMDNNNTCNNIIE